MTPTARMIPRLQGSAARLLQRLDGKKAMVAATAVSMSQQRSFATSNVTIMKAHSSAIATRAMSTTTATSQNDEQPSNQDPFADPETLILENAIHHVTEFGWSVDALAAGAKDVGYPSVAHGMLPRGAISLVDYYMDKCHQQTRETLIANTETLQAMSVADRLKFGVRTRLQLLEPVLPMWPQAMAIGALPQNAPTTMQKLAQLSDEIWYFAGDKSTDASWYTKRALLTGIYASTELFMLSDASPNYEETWKFLDRRIEETITLGELPRNLNDVAGMVNIGLQSMLSAAVSLAGPLSSQLVQNSPLGNVPNPISAMGQVPSSLAAGLSAAGLAFPANPLAGMPPTTSGGGSDFEPKDLREIDNELEKLGGSSSSSAN